MAEEKVTVAQRIVSLIQDVATGMAKWVESRFLTSEADGDPVSDETIDEYERITASLYQALTDAQTVTADSRTSTTAATDAATAAQQAADAATASAADADAAAGRAADAATQVANAYAGYATLDDRLSDIATAIAFTPQSDPVTLLS